MAQPPSDVFVLRYVDIPCPSRKHARSLATFCNRTVVAMFCIPCEHAWTESRLHPLLAHLHRDSEPR